MFDTLKKPKISKPPAKPPAKMSEMVDLCIDDIKKVEASKGYAIRMSTWHSPDSNGLCHVCAAGAIIAKTLKAPKDDGASPRLFPAWTGALNAMDYMRSNELLYAIRAFYGAFEAETGGSKAALNKAMKKAGIYFDGNDFNDKWRFTDLPPEITPYDDDKVEFKRSARRFARWLEARGL